MPPEPNWPSRSPATVVQAAALYCLELTGSFTTAQVRGRLSLMGTLTRYFAARCLLTDGHRDGLGVLLDLETQRRREGFPELDTELAAGLSVAIVQVLREVRGRGRIDDLDLLWDWYEGLPDVPPQELPPAVFLELATHR